MSERRRPHEAPAAVARLGWRHHHVGIPHEDARPDEQHLRHLGVHVAGFESSPCGIEWMRFEPHWRVPDIVRTTPHVAFVVDDLEGALAAREVVIALNSHSNGVRVAFIVENGEPVELLEFMHTRGSTTLVAVGRWYHSSNQNIYGADRNPGLDAVGFFMGFERAR